MKQAFVLFSSWILTHPSPSCTGFVLYTTLAGILHNAAAAGETATISSTAARRLVVYIWWSRRQIAQSVCTK